MASEIQPYLIRNAFSFCKDGQSLFFTVHKITAIFDSVKFTFFSESCITWTHITWNQIKTT